jgi:hypothetical protein
MPAPVPRSAVGRPGPTDSRVPLAGVAGGGCWWELLGGSGIGGLQLTWLGGRRALLGRGLGASPSVHRGTNIEFAAKRAWKLHRNLKSRLETYLVEFMAVFGVSCPQRPLSRSNGGAGFLFSYLIERPPEVASFPDLIF